MLYTQYLLSTGEVVGSGWTNTDDTTGLEKEGQGVLTGYEYQGGWIEDGIHFPLPESPSGYCTFNWTTKVWEDLRTLEDTKVLRRSIINDARLKANQTSFTFQGKKIAVDTLSRSDIDAVHGIVTLTNEMPDDWVGGWKTMDNTYVAIPDVATWALFYKAMVGQGSINFAHSQALKAQLAAATTIEEVEAIVW